MNTNSESKNSSGTQTSANEYWKNLSEEICKLPWIDLPWIEQVSSEFSRFTNQFNQDTNENIEILQKDLSKQYENLKHYLNPKNIEMNASELRAKTIQDLYYRVKIDIVKNKNLCKCESVVETTSSKIVDALIQKLKEEGFDVETLVVESEKTILRIEW